MKETITKFRRDGGFVRPVAVAGKKSYYEKE
jgi:hypothetical protein